MRDLAILALLGLSTLSCRRPARIDPALASLVPPDAVFLAGIRADAVRETPAYREWIAPALQDFARHTSLDLPTDVTQALLASDGASLLVMARGNFAREPTGARRTAYKGYTLIGDDRAAVVFIDSTTAVGGPPAALRELIDRRGRGTNAALLRRAEALSADAQIWAVSIGAPAPPSGLPGNLRRIAPMVESFSAQADLRAGVKLTIDAQCRTPENARSLAEALGGLRTFARFAARGDPALQQAYDAIRIERTDQSVRVAAELPEDLIERLAASR